MTYLVGDPTNGPFANLKSDTETAARIEASGYGKVVDEMDWTDDYGQPTVLFIVVDDQDPNGEWPSEYPDREYAYDGYGRITG